MGKLIALLLVILAVGTAYLFIGQNLWWFPHNISTHGQAIDDQFMRTLVVVGVAFTLAQLALGYVVFRFGSRGNERATYSHGSNKLEAVWTVATAVIFVALAILGQRVWISLHLNAAADGAYKIEVVAQQFQWNFHYPGPDGVFGRSEPQFINDSALNYVGLDPADPNGKDDAQVTTLAIPKDREVELTLRSKDVIHSFFAPVLRFKQDTVPGMAIRVHFTATETGRYDIPCAELCGSLHYNMKSSLLVVTQDEFQSLVSLPEEKFKDRLNELMAQYQQ